MVERRGSGLRKIVSEIETLPGYTKACRPEFFSTATDFRVILKNVNYHLGQKDLVSDQDSDQDGKRGRYKEAVDSILDFCQTARSKQEICTHLGYKNLTYFTRKYLKHLLESGQLRMTLPDKPQSRHQKYVTVQGGPHDAANHH